MIKKYITPWIERSKIVHPEWWEHQRNGNTTGACEAVLRYAHNCKVQEQATGFIHSASQSKEEFICEAERTYERRALNGSSYAFSVAVALFAMKNGSESVDDRMVLHFLREYVFV